MKKCFILTLLFWISFASYSFANIISVKDPVSYLNKGVYKDDIYIQEFFKDAVSYWGGLPAHCVIRSYDNPSPGIAITNTSERPSLLMGIPTNIAYASMVGCFIVLNDLNGYNPHHIRKGKKFMCNVIVHELGHNIGYDHIDDISNIMNPSLVEVVPHCERWDNFVSEIPVQTVPSKVVPEVSISQDPPVVNRNFKKCNLTVRKKLKKITARTCKLKIQTYKHNHYKMMP